MKKIFLSLGVILTSLSGFAQSEVNTSDLDFEYQGIYYTVIDPVAKTCRTKSGSSYISTEPKLITNYGNSIGGDVVIPPTVTGSVAGGSEETYTVIAVGDYAFNNPTSVSLPPTVQSIGTGAFAMAINLTTFNMGDGVTTVGENVFSGCGALTSVTLSNSLTAISPSMFASCKELQDITIPESVQVIGNLAFSRCSALTKVVIPSSVTQLGNSAFYGCSKIVSLELPENLTAIPASAFSYAQSLTSVAIPAGVTSIGDAAFSNCSSLKEVISYALVPPVISGNSFSDSSYSGVLKVYNSVISAYSKSINWKSFTTISPIQVNPTGITIDKSVLSLAVGFSSQLNASLSPENAIGDITWSFTSQPENAISLSQNGKVLAQRIGTATVTASCGDYNATCDITITQNSYETVKISPVAGTIYVGDEVQMSAVVTPSTITAPITWSSSNPLVATIDAASGLLKAVGEGGVLITAQCEGITGKLSLTINPVPAFSVVLDKTSVTFKAGMTETLNAVVSPANTTYPQVIWETSDPNVATVSGGTVTAIGVGSCVIRAMCGEASAICNVTVEPTQAESVTLSEQNVILKPGQVSVLSATVMPSTTSDKTITWTSSNESVATVTVDGIVNALTVGSSVITATCGNVSATCSVTVEPILASEVVLNYTSLSLMVNQVQQLVATVADDVTDKTITWNTSDPSVAIVVDGLVTAVGVGTATIQAVNGNAVGTCTVTVNPIPVESLVLDATSVTLNVGVSRGLNVTINPADATNPQLVWASSDPEVASVSGGVITGVNPGSATVTVSCGSITATCVVTVLQPAQSISLNYSALTLQVGEMEDIIATITPANTTDVAVWSSSLPAVATVNDHGIVEANAPGTTIITVTCGSVSAACTVTVTAIEAETITLNAETLTLNVTESFNLVATVMPDNVTDPSIVWISDNDKVVSVTNTGVVKALAEGTAKITASCGNISAECVVTVVAPEPQTVVISYSTLTLHATETFQLSATVDGAVLSNSYTWSSSNSNVATVSADGLVTAIMPGETDIRVTYPGSSATCKVTVTTTTATLVVLNDNDITMREGEMFSLKATVYPEYTTDKSVTWSSDNTDVATVDAQGTVNAVSEGYAVITAYCGNVFAQCTVTVTSASSDQPGGDDNNGDDNNGGDDNGDDNNGDNNGGDNGDDNPGDDNPGGDNGDEGGVEQIITDSEVYNVFTINGYKVLNTTEKGELQQLAPGLYIINGQKILVK